MFVRIALLAFASVLAAVGCIFAFSAIWDGATNKRPIEFSDIIIPLVFVLPILVLGPFWNKAYSLWSKYIGSKATAFLVLALAFGFVLHGLLIIVGINNLGGGFLVRTVTRVISSLVGPQIAVKVMAMLFVLLGIGMAKEMTGRSLVFWGRQIKPSKFEDNLLLQATAWSRVSTINELLDKGDNVNQANNYGNTALHFATMNNKPEIVSLLLSKGANRYAINKNEETALQIAQSSKFDKIVELLSK
jgi:hypothetical protein